jgi:hypothetical protein
MKQPIPKVTGDDVKRIAIRDFGKDLFSQVMSILQEYGKQDWNYPGNPPVGPRVYLAILKLANGNLEKLSEQTKVAIHDFRDVLSIAEYPRYTKEIGFDRAKGKVEQEIIAEDWEQYQEWLERC